MAALGASGHALAPNPWGWTTRAWRHAARASGRRRRASRQPHARCCVHAALPQPGTALELGRARRARAQRHQVSAVGSDRALKASPRSCSKLITCNARSFERRRSSPIRSAGVRVNALGFPVELAAIRALDGPRPRWQFDLGGDTEPSFSKRWCRLPAMAF